MKHSADYVSVPEGAAMEDLHARIKHYEKVRLRPSVAMARLGFISRGATRNSAGAPSPRRKLRP